MEGIGAVILAAGQAKRFGSMKQLSYLGEKPLFLYPVELALSMEFSCITLVGNKHTESMKDYIQDYNISYIKNEESENGMSSSLKKGISALPSDIQAVFLFLGDQPFIPKEVVIKMYSIYQDHYENGIRIVRALYEGQAGHPVLFDRELFPLLINIEGDQGARDIIRLFSSKVETVDFPKRMWNMDIDTQSDYEQAIRVLANNTKSKIDY
ncbi:NTP transferase domain-containing protein [Peribacillus sp. SCS-155]|uniref:nucleotidyltransferase family protein n=1 Tax=Peribacillus sedimenti TaxID=3115297 RepID=UPI003905D6E2